MRRVVVTGIGAVTPLGCDARSSWANLLSQKSGLRHLAGPEFAKLPVRLAATVPNFPLDQWEDPQVPLPPSQLPLSRKRLDEQRKASGVCQVCAVCCNRGDARCWSGCRKGLVSPGANGKPCFRQRYEIDRLVFRVSALARASETSSQYVPHGKPMSKG